MRRIVTLFLSAVLMLSCIGCAGKQTEQIEPQISQMRSICELSVMECYYHNVAKCEDEDAEGFLFFKKDRKFWVEYTGIVKLGIDASFVKMEMNGEEVTITIPEAEVLSCKVDSSSITEDSYIVQKGSATITAEDERKAFETAQEYMRDAASKDHSLLNSAQQRAQELIENYVNNIGDACGKKYTIRWEYLDAEGKPLGTYNTSSDEIDENNTNVSDSVSETTK